ncbi:MAG: hypothetical protein AAB921_02500 [Patescibacteria group bacterium]
METITEDGFGLILERYASQPLTEEETVMYRDKGWELSADPWHAGGEKMETGSGAQPVLRYIFRKIQEPEPIPEDTTI